MKKFFRDFFSWYFEDIIAVSIPEFGGELDYRRLHCIFFSISVVKKSFGEIKYLVFS